MQNYVINMSAPQTQRFYDWQKDGLGCGNWFIDGKYCGNCHTNLSWSWSFCPKCGFMINGIANSNPPGEE